MEIVYAMHEWNGLLVEHMSEDCTQGVWTISRGTTPDGNSGWTEHRDHTVTVSLPANSPYFYALILHELGHTAGFYHHNDIGVMNHNTGTILFSPADVGECEKGECEPYGL